MAGPTRLATESYRKQGILVFMGILINLSLQIQSFNLGSCNGAALRGTIAKQF